MEIRSPQTPSGDAPRYTCPYCSLKSDGRSGTCPQCGGPVDVRAIVSPARWAEVPGQKGEAKVQFGGSHCRISGSYVPAVEADLAAGDGVYFAHHILLWMEPGLHVGAMSMKGAFKRVLAGMPIVMAEAKGPGRIAFSRDAPGELLALPLQPGEAVDVREHLLVFATDAVAYDWFQTDIWYKIQIQRGNDRETEVHRPLGLFMDRFSAGSRPGLLVLHASGNVFVRDLAEGQSILVKPTALLYKDPAVGMQLHFEHPAATWSAYGAWTQRYVWLRLQGPGRVALMSAFEPVHGENGSLVACSPATQRHW